MIFISVSGLSNMADEISHLDGKPTGEEPNGLQR